MPSSSRPRHCLAPQDDVRPPSSRELKALLAELQAVEPYRADSRAGRRAARALRRARGAVGPAEEAPQEHEKAWEDGRELPRKGGEHWYWEDERRGRFFLSGKTKKPKGLFIGLHGGGVGSADASGSYGAYRGAADKRGWLSIYPQALEATERGWTDSGTEEWIMTLIDEARRTFDVPADQVFIGGHSMGGYGSWVLSAHHADLFAAAVLPCSITPVCGLGRRTSSTSRRASSRTCGTRRCACSRARTTCAWPEPNLRPSSRSRRQGCHGGFEDSITGRSGTAAGFPEGGTYAPTRIDGFTRDPHPERVVWEPSLTCRTSFYRLDWPTLATGVTVDAAVDREAGTIEVRTNGEAPGLAVLLDAVGTWSPSPPSRSTTPRSSACQGRRAPRAHGAHERPGPDLHGPDPLTELADRAPRPRGPPGSAGARRRVSGCPLPRGRPGLGSPPETR